MTPCLLSWMMLPFPDYESRPPSPIAKEGKMKMAELLLLKVYPLVYPTVANINLGGMYAFLIVKFNENKTPKIKCVLTLLNSERPKLYTSLAFLSSIGFKHYIIE